MSATWYGDAPPPDSNRFGPSGWVRIVVKGVLLAVLVFGSLLLLLVVRLFEKPLFGVARPVTPHITVFVCRNALRLIGLQLVTKGKFSPHVGAVVANHSSWLDIFVLNATKRLYFVSKSEVASWPGIGWLARATGTVFIERNRARAAEHTQVFQRRLGVGHRLLFFPEGTSSDGQRVLPFKATLFAAFFTPDLKGSLEIQPVTVSYSAPSGQDRRFYSWWGDMTFDAHLLKCLAHGSGGQVVLTYHDPLYVHDFVDRKALAAACEDLVRCAHKL